jgi:hypothetical protein
MSDEDNSPDSAATFERIKQTAQRARQQLGPAFTSSWFYTGVGLLLGFRIMETNISGTTRFV